MNLLSFRTVLASTWLVAATSPGLAAPQTFNTALPVAQGEFVFRQQAFIKKASKDPSAADRDLTVLGKIGRASCRERVLRLV